MKDKHILYHYTSIEGARGILTSQSIWMSDVRYLNDSQELDKAMKTFLENVDPKMVQTLSMAIYWGNLTRNHCVFALSSSPNILSQWRAYGDDGQGMAIGFDEKYLTTGWAEQQGILVDRIYENHEDFLKETVHRLPNKKKKK